MSRKQSEYNLAAELMLAGLQEKLDLMNDVKLMMRLAELGIVEDVVLQEDKTSGLWSRLCKFGKEFWVLLHSQK